jgi:voltage-gated potassium channel
MIQFLLTTRRLFGDPQFRSLLLLVVLTLVGGTIFYSLQEGWNVVDAFYFSAITLTTVGLGDLSPETTIGKLFTVVYIFAGIGIILGFIETVAKEAIERQAGRSGSERDHDEAPEG